MDGYLLSISQSVQDATNIYFSPFWNQELADTLSTTKLEIRAK
jgi:lysozyme family protein